MRRRVNFIRAVSRLAAGAVVALGCRKGAEAGADSATAHAAVGAKTVVVATQAFTETLGSIGNVVARSGHVATLMAPAAGRVATVLVTTGQAVTKDQTLVELDQAPFQAALLSAEATLRVAEQANERQQRLAQEGIIARKDAEQAAADVAKARADEVSVRRTAQLSILRSPISGVVTRMSATLGASVDPAQPLVEISDPTALDVLMSVTPTQAASVRPGARVALSAGQSANGEPLGIGSVVDVSGMVDSSTRSVAVRVQAPTTRRPLRIGETIFGAITVATRPSAIVVPIEALVLDGESYKVFVVDGKEMAHEREVKIGGKTSTVAEIIDGLKVGERIVTYGAYGMQDSAKVVPLTPPAEKGDSADKPDEKSDEKSDKADKGVKSDKPAVPAKPAKP